MRLQKNIAHYPYIETARAIAAGACRSDGSWTPVRMCGIYNMRYLDPHVAKIDH